VASNAAAGAGTSAGAGKELRDRIIASLWPPAMPSRTQVWAILDGARDPKIFGTVDGTYLEKCCLYAGTLPWQLKMAAPYLVQLRKDDSFTRILLDQGWGNSWGVYLRSDTDLKSLRKHLRGFLRVRGPRGERLVFRYYDPRVLRLYLPTCTKEELTTVYGPIAQFLMEAKDPHELLEFAFDGAALQERRLRLDR
jgi:hypothetical protein